MRALLTGLFAGAFLSAYRAPLGLELLQLPATTAGMSHGLRALALLVVAVGLAFRGARRWSAGAGVGLLCGTCVGFALHGLVWAARPQSHFALVAVALLGLAVLFGLARGPEPRPAGAADEAAPEPPRHGPGDASGIGITAAGATLALEGVLRHLRELGGGRPADDALFGALFLLVAALGGAMMLPLLRTRRARSLARPLALALLALACFVSLRAVANLADPRGLHGFLRRFGLDTSEHGTLAVDAALAAPLLALPALFAGTALLACRRPVQAAALLVGAAAGTAAVPRVLHLAADAGALVEGGPGPSLLRAGTLVAGAGLLLASFASRELGRAQAWSARALAVAVAAVALLVPSASRPIAAPWLTAPPLLTWSLETPSGWLAVGAERSGVAAVTLAGRRIAPSYAEAPADRAQLELAWSCLDPGVRAGGEVDVLLVGQLTPGRALTLRQLGARRVDRTAAWAAAMPALEERLFGGAPQAAGQALSLAAARARLGAGEYELVLVPPVPEAVPTTRNLASPEGTTVVAWLDAGAGLERVVLGPRVLPCTVDLTGLALGLVHGSADERAVELGLLPGGPAGARATPLQTLARRRDVRRRDATAAVARRLEQASAEAHDDPSAARVAHALALHFAAQERSSPFDTAEQSVELDREALGLLRDAALERPPSPWLRSALETLARVLTGKRWVEETLAFVEPVADARFPWPALERATVHAHLELLEPEVALERLERLVRAAGAGAEDHALLGAVCLQVGQDARAAAELGLAVSLVEEGDGVGAVLAAEGERHAWRRLHAIARVRAGDPGGADAVRRLLLEDPDDEALEPYLGPAPWPPPPPALQVGRLHAD